MSARLIHRIGIALMLVVLVGSVASPGLAREQGDELEEVVFPLTLEGEVPPTHTFAVRRECAEQTCVTEESVIVCSPPQESYRYEPCAAKTYEFASQDDHPTGGMLPDTAMASRSRGGD